MWKVLNHRKLSLYLLKDENFMIFKYLLVNLVIFAMTLEHRESWILSINTPRTLQFKLFNKPVCLSFKFLSTDEDKALNLILEYNQILK